MILVRTSRRFQDFSCVFIKEGDSYFDKLPINFCKNVKPLDTFEEKDIFLRLDNTILRLEKLNILKCCGPSGLTLSKLDASLQNHLN
jgi:hypothetical protein